MNVIRKNATWMVAQEQMLPTTLWLAWGVADIDTDNDKYKKSKIKRSVGKLINHIGKVNLWKASRLMLFTLGSSPTYRSEIYNQKHYFVITFSLSYTQTPTQTYAQTHKYTHIFLYIISIIQINQTDLSVSWSDDKSIYYKKLKVHR